MTERTTTAVGLVTPSTGSAGHSALLVVGAAQLMVVLDATVVNVALPGMQGDLGLSTASLSWVLNAYALTYGGLLLLGGRAGDLLGRRQVFLSGVALFTIASCLGGFAQSGGQLFAARALQGLGGALISPTALALVTTNSAAGRDRNRALGMFATVSGVGGSVGLLVGGVLTSLFSWRWAFFVNVLIGPVVIAAARRHIAESERVVGRFDLGGAVASTLAMSSCVYGFIRVAQNGWADERAAASFAVAAILFAVFVMIERLVDRPITPLGVFRQRSRTRSLAIMLGVCAAQSGVFFFLTLFLQHVLRFSPLETGMAFLPLCVVMVMTMHLAGRVVTRTGVPPLLFLGSSGVVAGLALLSRIEAGSTYVEHILLPMLLVAAGMGLLWVPLTADAVSGLEPNEAGAAAGLLNAVQQAGSAIGLAVLVTIFTSARDQEWRRQLLAGRVAQQRDSAGTQSGLGAGSLPEPTVSQVLAHGISTALAAAIALFVVPILGMLAASGVVRLRSRTSLEQPAERLAAPPTDLCRATGRDT